MIGVSSEEIENYPNNIIMNKRELQLTSVKVHRELFEEFKIECVKTKFSFQKLSDRAI